ncbi:MAG: hypothetical protein MUC39_00780 [Candidatus Omnitrophica bacterium]|jgi:beta-glucuronidase|nr:hypothetical protein [Candidatus Omnitrophota bacterium]
MTKFKAQNKSKFQIPNIKTKVLLFGICVLVLFCHLCFGICHLYAEDAKPSSGELITKAWAVHGQGDIEATFKYTQECINLYSLEADKEQASLKELPKGKREIEAVEVLNDVATAYFIQAESYMQRQMKEEAVKTFKIIIDKYNYAQAWDQRGWFWQISKTAQESIDKLEGRTSQTPPKQVLPKVSQLSTKIVLYDPGKEDIVNYEKYGEFQNVGTKDYKYAINDQEGLSAAVGEGIFPNTTSIRWDPEFKKALKEKRLEGTHWDFLHSPDLEAAFLKWATSSEPQGVRLFYTAQMLEKSGLIKHAIKCYYAIVVHFPGSYGWTYWHTPWYLGQAAVAKINYLLKNNPQIGYKLADADIKIINGFDNDVSNDIAVVNPGAFIKIKPLEKLKSKPDRNLLSVKKRRGKGKVHLLQYETGDWELIVHGKPYVVKGVTYTPTKVGQSPDNGTQTNWMEDDFNQNGIIDGPYEAFVDRNMNNLQDKDEPAVGDFKLMKEMGVNTIRLYHQPFKVDKELLRDMYEKYGIMVIMGDFFGKYAIGSGAQWNPGTDYTDDEQKKKMKKSVLGMVEEFKGEPYVLFWLLGNENVYGYACNADKEPDAFFKFADEVALAIKAIDTDHPVAIGNGDILFLDKLGKDAPNIDIVGVNAYRGNYGFGFLWRQAKEAADIPVVVTEFGCPAYAQGKNTEESESLQAEYYRGSWEDIEDNMAFKTGAGNSLGGVVFEWLDEWWKQYEPFIHDTRGVAMGPFPDGYYHEEWFGLNSQGDGKLSPFLRQLRQSYYTYKKMWK